jgi:uncharacterized RDD family membrane protein YckC
MKNNLAGLEIRSLAGILDWFIETLPVTFFIMLIIQSSDSFTKLISNILLFIVIYLIPIATFGLNLWYRPYFTNRFGGTIGKLLTGLKITDDAGNNLSYSRSLFRHFVGYPFASLILGWGYWSIVRDPEKKGWHDHATGSKVIVTKNQWPIAILSILVLIVVHYFFINSAYSAYSNGTLKQEVAQELALLLAEDASGDNLPTSEMPNTAFYDQYQNVLKEYPDGNTAIAEEESLKLLELAGNDAEKASAYDLLSLINYNKGEYTKSKDYAQKAVDLNPNVPEFYQALTQAQLSLGNYRQAIDSAQKAVNLKPDSAGLHYTLGLTSYLSGNTKQGLVEIQKAVELNPNNKEYQEMLKQLQSGR